MRRQLLFAIGILVIILTLVALMLPPIPQARANMALDDMRRLDGYSIYFSEIGEEASRFDRTGAGLSRLTGLLEMVGADTYTLEWRTGVPLDADLVVIPGPVKDLSPEQTAWLWAYLQNGGRLLLLADPNVKPINALKSNAGLFRLMWTDMGLRARDDVVVTQGEPQLAMPPADAVREGTPTPTPAPAVEVPSLISSFVTDSFNSYHPILADLTGELAFFGARSIEVDEAPAEAQVTGLVYADVDFYGETEFQTYVDTDYASLDAETDTAASVLVLAAAMEDTSTGAKIVLIGDREFATNGGGLQTSPPYSSSFLYPDNVRFLLNAITWLLGAESSEAELTFPTAGPTATPTITPSPTPEAPTEESDAS